MSVSTPAPDVVDRAPTDNPPEKGTVIDLLVAMAAEIERGRVERAALLAKVNALEHRFDALATGRGPRDDADRRLVTAVAGAVGSRAWTAVELLAHAEVDPELAAALQAADCDGARTLGCLCRRLVGIAVGGLVIEQDGQARDGRLWRVTVTAG